ncbi:hypothetical protein EB796_013488 [Bugula neritina]|uniref:Matrix-remodeling-associated protein 7 helical domain-containing protein n=1 Tax=Bugula neritina TaxID=10212 RepID=A0A7J7JPF8_BUGNE|nr:hypothetical protein EB796_013488 [Bugula neritina]
MSHQLKNVPSSTKLISPTLVKRGKLENVSQLFCPFGGKESACVWSDGDDTAVETETPTLGEHGIQNSKLCISEGNTRYANDSTQNTNKECPYQFAFENGADSEDEADVPSNHRRTGRCPLDRHDKPVSLNNLRTAGHMQEKTSLAAIHEKLSADELQEEIRVRKEQIAAIAQLLAAQEDDCSTIQPQLKLYM